MINSRDWEVGKWPNPDRWPNPPNPPKEVGGSTDGGWYPV